MWGWFGWNEFDDQIQQSIRFEQEFIKICSISMWGWFGWNEFDDQIQQSIRFWTRVCVRLVQYPCEDDLVWNEFDDQIQQSIRFEQEFA